MRDPLAHTSKRCRPVKATAADHEQVRLIRKIDQRLNRPARIVDDVRAGVADPVEIDRLPAGCRDEDQLGTESLGDGLRYLRGY